MPAQEALLLESLDSQLEELPSAPRANAALRAPYPSPQCEVTPCETAAKCPKKPCFLKVWIHDWKNCHGSKCGSCQKTGGCCKCCKNHGGAAPVTASGQAGLASIQGAPTGQTGTRP